MLINSFLYVFLFYGMEQRIFSLSCKLSMLDHLKLVIYATGTFLKYSGFHICYLILRCTIGCKLDFEIYDKLFNWFDIDWIFVMWNNIIFIEYDNPIYYLMYNKILPCFFLSIKVVVIACLFILIRAILPRYRFDQLMNLCWKKILPVSFSFFLFYISAIYNFDGLLYNLEINLLGNPFFHIYIFSLT